MGNLVVRSFTIVVFNFLQFGIDSSPDDSSPDNEVAFYTAQSTHLSDLNMRGTREVSTKVGRPFKSNLQGAKRFVNVMFG